jgi:hypothetical protein
MDESEVTAHEIDRNMIDRMIAAVPEDDKKIYGLASLKEHIFIQISLERRETLATLCKSRRIQYFYFLLNGRPLPHVKDLQDHEVSALVHEIAKHANEWLSLPVEAKRRDDPVDIEKIFDDCDQLTTILESLFIHKLITRAQDLRIFSQDSEPPTSANIRRLLLDKVLALPRELMKLLETNPIGEGVIQEFRDPINECFFPRYLEAIYYHKQLTRAQELAIVSRDIATKEEFLERITQEWRSIPTEGKKVCAALNIREIFYTPNAFQNLLARIYDHRLHVSAQDCGIVPLDSPATAKDELLALLTKEWLSLDSDARQPHEPVAIEEILNKPFQMRDILETISHHKQITLGKNPTRNPDYKVVQKTRPDGTTNPVQTIKYSLLQLVNCQFSETDLRPINIVKVIPDVVATPQGLSIRIPYHAAQKGFDRQLQRCLQEKGIFLRGNPIDFSLKGATYVHEFMIPSDKIQKFFLDVLNIPEEKLQKEDPKNCFGMFMDESPALTGYKNVHIFTHDYIPGWPGTNWIPHCLETISLRLAQLDPSLTALQLKNIQACSLFPPSELKVVSDIKGFVIKIAEGKEDLRDSLERIFLLSGRPINEIHNETSYSYEVRVNRDDIPEFLRRTQLLNVPDRLPEDFHPSNTYKYEHIAFPYLSFLEETGLYYRYEPTVVERNPLRSICTSVKDLVPNEADITPTVTMHPRGWMSIQFQHTQLNIAYRSFGPIPYLAFLQEFLKRQATETNSQIRIIIPKDEIERFVTKQLRLPQAIYDQLIASLPPPYTPQHQTKQIGDVKVVDVLGSICRSLASLNPETRETLKRLPPSQLPDPSLPLPIITVDPNGLKITIDEKQAFVINSFQYHAKGSPSGSKTYCIPQEQVRAFLEQDLQLQTLPLDYQREGCKTYYNELLLAHAATWGLVYEPSGSVSINGLKLKNPPLQMPESIPLLSKEKVIQSFADILEKHLQKETFIANYIRLWDDAQELLHHPEQEYRDTATLCLNYLLLLAHEVQKEGTDQAKAQHTLVELGVRCAPGICFPGRVTSLQLEFQKFVNPATADEVKFFILQTLETLKTDMLTTLLGTHPQSVHIVTYLQDRWQDALGFTPLLDVYGIGDGSYGEQMTRNFLESLSMSEEEFKRQFVTAYRGTDPQSPYPNKSNVFKAIYEKLIGDTDQNGIIMNIGLYQERMRTILKQQGMQDNEIDAQILRWIPEVDGIQGKSIHPEAVELILADIGILNP